MFCRMLVILVAFSSAASAEPRIAAEPYLEPMLFTYQDLDVRVSGVRTQLAAGAELVLREPEGATSPLAGRIGLTVGHQDIGGSDHKTVGIELGGSVALDDFGRIGPNVSLATGTRELVYFSTAGLRYRYRFVTVGVEVGWTKYAPRDIEPFHRRQLFAGIGFTGKPGVATITGAIVLGLAELVMASFPRT